MTNFCNAAGNNLVKIIAHKFVSIMENDGIFRSFAGFTDTFAFFCFQLSVSIRKLRTIPPIYGLTSGGSTKLSKCLHRLCLGVSNF